MSMLKLYMKRDPSVLDYLQHLSTLLKSAYAFEDTLRNRLSNIDYSNESSFNPKKLRQLVDRAIERVQSPRKPTIIFLNDLYDELTELIELPELQEDPQTGPTYVHIIEDMLRSLEKDIDKFDEKEQARDKVLDDADLIALAEELGKAARIRPQTGPDKHIYLVYTAGGQKFQDINKVGFSLNHMGEFIAKLRNPLNPSKDIPHFDADEWHKLKTILNAVLVELDEDIMDKPQGLSALRTRLRKYLAEALQSKTTTSAEGETSQASTQLIPEEIRDLMSITKDILPTLSSEVHDNLIVEDGEVKTDPYFVHIYKATLRKIPTIRRNRTLDLMFKIAYYGYPLKDTPKLTRTQQRIVKAAEHVEKLLNEEIKGVALKDILLDAHEEAFDTLPHTVINIHPDLQQETVQTKRTAQSSKEEQDKRRAAMQEAANIADEKPQQVSVTAPHKRLIEDLKGKSWKQLQQDFADYRELEAQRAAKRTAQQKRRG